MKRTPWTERTFTFDLPAGWMPNVLERLRGASARIDEIARSISDHDAVHKPDGRWSVKENIGHLLDMEQLHEGRIDDFLARVEVLRPADRNNTATYTADHNSTSLAQLADDFRNLREGFVSRLEGLDDETQLFASLHPRIQTMMRPIDLACFVAEHDDHHLATVRELIVAREG